MDLKRITVDEVKEAYAATGVRKTKAAYYWMDTDVEDGAPPIDCGCPAFAVALYRQGLTVAALRAANGGWCCGANFTHDQFNPFYLGGFTHAVDTGRAVATENAEPLYHEGAEDGLAVRAALWPEPANA